MTSGIPCQMRATVLTSSLLAAAVLAGCAHQPAATTAAAAPSVPAQPAAEVPTLTQPADASLADEEAGAAMASEPSAETGATAESAEGENAASEESAEAREWLVDEEGRRFYVDRIQRLESYYRQVGENQINYLGNLIDIVGSDDDYFYVKVYEPEPVERPSERELSDEELAAREAAYRAETPTADRLQFVPFGQGLPQRGQWRNGFTLADMNADGHLDIVHAPPRKLSNLPVIFLGDGRGNWEVWSGTSYPGTYDYGDAAVADFNGDGHLDLALGIHLRGVQVLLGDGQGNFREWSKGLDYEIPGQGGAGEGFSSRAIAPVDWNGDGRPDLIALGEGPRPARPMVALQRGPTKAGSNLSQLIFGALGPTLYLNGEDGSWSPRRQNLQKVEIFGDSLAVGDFDADGRPDFVTASNVMARRDLIHLGDGEGGWRSQELAPLPPNSYSRAVVAADFDGDGRDDIGLTYSAYELGKWHNGIDVYYSRADGVWERRVVATQEERLPFHALGCGDVDGDGAIDLIAFDLDGHAVVALGDGEGFFVLEESPELQQPLGRCRAYDVKLGDLDGDGRAEVVADFADEASAYFDPDRCPQGGGMAAWDVAKP